MSDRTIQQLCETIGCSEKDLCRIAEQNPNLEAIVLDAVNSELNVMRTELKEVEQRLAQQ